MKLLTKELIAKIPKIYVSEHLEPEDTMLSLGTSHYLSWPAFQGQQGQK